MTKSDIKHEDEIIWLEPIEDLGYVREILMFAHTRRRPISGPSSALNKSGKPGKKGTPRTVGYAVLKPDAPCKVGGMGRMPGCYDRRVFWVAEHDRCNAPEGVYKNGNPVEGVDPRTVAPRVLGTPPARSS